MWITSRVIHKKIPGFSAVFADSPTDRACSADGFRGGLVNALTEQVRGRQDFAGDPVNGSGGGCSSALRVRSGAAATAAATGVPSDSLLLDGLSAGSGPPAEGGAGLRAVPVKVRPTWCDGSGADAFGAGWLCTDSAGLISGGWGEVGQSSGG